jgi:flagellar motor component MotA
MRELMLDGVTGIVQGLHPKLIEQRLEPYLNPSEKRRGATRAAVVREEAA